MFVLLEEMLRSLSALRVLTNGYNQVRLLTAGSSNTLKVKEEVKRVGQLALLGGGQKRIDSQHKKGKKISVVKLRPTILVWFQEN